MTQQMDIARGATATTAVFVIGTHATDVPAEMNALITSKVYEPRYDSCVDEVVPSNSQNNRQEVTFVAQPTNTFMRVRNWCVGESFNCPVSTLEQPLTNTSLTPMFGMGVTFFDQIYFQMGNNSQVLCPSINDHHELFMQKYMSPFTKKNITNRHWWQLAGFTNVSSFDYCGGTATSDNPAFTDLEMTEPQATPVTDTGILKPYYPSISLGSNFSSSLVQAPFPPHGAAQPNPDYNRQMEGGFFYDPEMQLYRSLFYANNKCNQVNYLVKLGILSSGFETPLCLPGLQVQLKLRYPESNRDRKRYICTPNLSSGADANGLIVNLIDQATFPGFTPNIDYFRIYLTNVNFRGDWQTSYLNVWVGGNAISDSIEIYDWFSKGIENETSLDITIVNPGNNVPAQTATSFQLLPPYQGLMNHAVTPPGVCITPYCYTDCNLSSCRTSVSTYKPLNYSIEYWQSGQRMTRFDPLGRYTAAFASQKGVNDLYSTWHSAVVDSQGFHTLSADDLDPGREFQEYNAAILGVPNGVPLEPATKNYSILGSAAQLCNNVYYGTGLHNQFLFQVLNPLGYVDNTIDYGVANGSLRTNLKFLNMVSTPIRFNHLSVLPVQFSYVGSGNVVTNLSI